MINSNKLFDEVFNEVFDSLKDIRLCISKLPMLSFGRSFLLQFLEEKEKSILRLSKEDIFKFNDVKYVSAI